MEGLTGTKFEVKYKKRGISFLLMIGGGYMNIEQAIDIIYTGLVGVNSVPVKLAAHRIFDLDMLNQVRKALDFAIKYYEGKASVPKKLRLPWSIFKEHFSFKVVLRNKC